MKGAIFCCIITFYILTFKTNVVTNLNPPNSDNKSFIFFLIAYLVFLSSSLGLKEFKISHYKYLYKHEIVSLFLQLL